MPHCNDAYRRTRPARSRLSASRGFTLLELLLVVTVLSAVAWMTLGTVSNNSDQIRFEDTRNRLAAIRRAIIGDTSRTVNGGPEVRGYVADMGQIPPNIQALITREYCNGHPEVTTNTGCTAAGGVWVTQPSYSFNQNYNLWMGWNGPYLPPEATALGKNYRRYLDGWGNEDSTNNFGWTYEDQTGATSPLSNLVIQSLGRDGVREDGTTVPKPLSTATFTYDWDYPTAFQGVLNPVMVLANEYRQKIQNVTVAFNGPSSCWKCKNLASPTRKECINAPAADDEWQPLAISDPSACTTYGGYWEPSASEQVCIRLVRIINGAIDDDAGGTVTEYHSILKSDPGSISQQLGGMQVTFSNVVVDTAPTTPVDVLDEPYMYLGHFVFGIFEYDGSSCTTKPVLNKESAVTNWKWKDATFLPNQSALHLQWTFSE